LDFYLKNREGTTVLASKNAWEKVRTLYPGHNFVMFSEGTEFTIGDITFRAVYAEHSDDTAIGVVFDAEGKRYYITGDTLYNRHVFETLPTDIDVVFLPINGKGNNMNIADAYRFVDRTGAKCAVPCHFGLFDAIDAKSEISRGDFVVPEPFREVLV